MRCGPTCCRLLSKRPKISPAVGQEFRMLVERIFERKGIVEQALVHRKQGRGEQRRIASHQGMVVVGGGYHDYPAKISFFNGVEELSAMLDCLQTLFRD